MKNKIVIGSLAMDLKRVALGYYNKSDKTAKVFSNEALKRLNEIDRKEVKEYLLKHIENLPKVLKQKDKMKLAEDALTNSVIFQNYAVNF